MTPDAQARALVKNLLTIPSTIDLTDPTTWRSGGPIEKVIANILRAARPTWTDERPTMSKCTWAQDGEGEMAYDTTCNRRFLLNEGTPTENHMKFCCYCGGELAEMLDTGEDQP